MATMFLPFKRYAEFSGRSSRKEYWLFTLFLTVVMGVIVGAVAGSMVAALMREVGDDTKGGLGAASMAFPGAAGLVMLAFGLAVLIPSLAVTVRRFHDQDKSGWLVLIGLIPYLGGLIVMIFMMLEGTRGPNRYGPDPLAPPTGAPPIATV